MGWTIGSWFSPITGERFVGRTRAPRELATALRLERNGVATPRVIAYATYPDSALVAAPGEVILIQSTRNGTGDVCAFDISPFIYTKILVDSIAVETKTVVLQTVMDPNCGFKSFEAGIPSR